MIFIDKEKWSEVLSFSEKAIVEFPLEGSFAIYRAIAVIHDKDLRYMKMKQMERIIDSIRSAVINENQKNTQQFLLSCINVGWSKPNGIKDIPVNSWEEDQEVNSLKTIIKDDIFKNLSPFDGTVSFEVERHIKKIISNTDKVIQNSVEKDGFESLNDIFDLIQKEVISVNSIGDLRDYYNGRHAAWEGKLSPEQSLNTISSEINQLVDNLQENFNEISDFIPDRISSVGPFFGTLILLGILMLIGSLLGIEAITEPWAMLSVFAISIVVAFKSMSKNRKLKKIKKQIPLLMAARDQINKELLAIKNIEIKSDGR